VSLSRRHFLLCSAAPALAQKKRPLERPNIVLILADGLAAWMLGCYGNKEIQTPNIDQLARAGTRFANNFVCTPICSASRATLFTGRTPSEHGIQDFLTPNPIQNPPQGQATPPPSFQKEVMLSDILAANGYNCGYVGEWHMGDDQKPQHGYRFWYTMLGGSSSYQDPKLSWNGEIVQEHGYLADLLTRKSVQFLEGQKSGQPFLLVTSYLNPHPPYDGQPQKYYDMYAKTPFVTTGRQPPAPNALRGKEYLQDIVGNLRKCAASVTALDDEVGALVQFLRKTNLVDNTMIIFTADDGFLLGRHGLWSDGLASNPINMYEEVMRTPMIWSWQGKVPADSVRPELISSYDFLPTVCGAANVSPLSDRALCGRSYLPLATNKPLPKKAPWHDLVFGQFRNTEMARDIRYKLILRNQGKGPNELYDLRRDPREEVNEFDNQGFTTVRLRLTKELDGWRKRCG
jgi:choline-sulfatase